MEYNTRIVTGTSILNLDLDPANFWLWKNYLPSCGLTGLTGASDCGKSTLLRQLAIAIAMGEKSFLGADLNAPNRRVLYVSSEDDELGTNLSLAKQAISLSISELDNVLFLFDSENLLKEITEEHSKSPFDLIILDTWSDHFRGNPNSFTDIRSELSKFKAFDCCVLLLHHNVKNSEKSVPDKNKMSGSQGLEAKLRSVLELRVGKNDNERFLTIVKGNYVPIELKQQSLRLTLNPSTSIFETTGKLCPIENSYTKQIHYDKDHWMKLIDESNFPENYSLNKRIAALREEFGESTPSSTWFKENRPNQSVGD